MKTTQASKLQNQTTDKVKSDEMLPEDDFDYRKAKPNRFAVQINEKDRTVVLDPDVAAVFTTSEAVNNALRAILSAIPQTVMSREKSEQE